MPSLKCYYCGTFWPEEEEFNECPTCRELTTSTAMPPMPSVLARIQAIRGRFGWWLYDHGRV